MISSFPTHVLLRTIMYFNVVILSNSAITVGLGLITRTVISTVPSSWFACYHQHVSDIGRSQH